MQIRSYLLSGNDVAAFTPMDLGDENHNLADIRRLEVAVLARLRTMSPKEMQKAPNVQGGLENRLYKAAKAARSLSELYFLTKTKRYTLARIRRAVMCCFLGITHSDVKLKPQYLRVLAMNETGKAILSSAKESTLPIDTSLAALAKKSEGAARQALLEDRCTNVYGLALEKRRVCGHEFTEKFVNR
jgi:predicted nucleotidyltransferase